MTARTCIVSVRDHHGRHSVEVAANSLYEAVVLGIRALKDDEWLRSVPLQTEVEVEVRPPSVTHRVTLKAVDQWIDSRGHGPADQMHRKRLGDLLHGRVTANGGRRRT